MDTIKLYDRDAYASSFQGKVVSCEKMNRKGQALYGVVLDQTLFFPEEGGQSADTGFLGSMSVFDVQIKDGVITHFLEKPLSPGEKVEGAIDFSLRFSKMQQHTGEHIFSGLVKKRFGFRNVGFRLSDKETTMDYDGLLSDEDILLLETEANRAIWADIPVSAEYPDKAVLETLDYRSKIEIDGPIRIVTIPGVDICACCAPHVRRTGEVGLLRIIAHEHYKGGIRLHALCGERALSDYRNKCDNTERICRLLSVKPQETAEAVTALQRQLEGEKQDKAGIEQKYIRLLAKAYPETKEDILLEEEGISMISLRELVNLLTQKTEGFVLALLREKTGNRYILASARRDVRPVDQLLREKFGAKGGGSSKMTQGSMPAADPQAVRSALSCYTE